MNFSLIGNHNLSFLIQDIKNSFLSSNIRINLVDIPFGQGYLYIHDEKSKLYQDKIDFFVFIERLEATAHYSEMTTKEFIDCIENKWNEHIEALRAAYKNFDCLFFVCNAFLIEKPFTSRLVGAEENNLIHQAIERINIKLNNEFSGLSDVFIIDINSLIVDLGRNNCRPGKYWYLARSPFSALLNKEISKLLLSIWMSHSGKSARLIVLDLDNTLWGGEIGEIGGENIQLGGDYPGNVYSEIQRALVEINDNGIMLAVCSKNTESVVLNYLKNDNNMIIDYENFLELKINWRSKSENIKELSRNLGIGLNNICFIDDSKYEREQVRHSLQNVLVPEMPSEVCEWPTFIRNIPQLTILNLSSESKSKTRQYKIRNEINKSLSSIGDSLDKLEYLKSLKMQVGIQSVKQSSIHRVTELLQKTNQFNMTGVVYSRKELIDNPSIKAFSISLKDRLGSDEIVGAIVIKINEKKLTIDNFVLSCRVLGRNIEFGVISVISNHFSGLFEELLCYVKKTERNIPAQGVYENYGFKYDSIAKMHKLTLCGHHSHSLDLFETIKIDV